MLFADDMKRPFLRIYIQEQDSAPSWNTPERILTENDKAGVSRLTAVIDEGTSQIEPNNIESV